MTRFGIVVALQAEAKTIIRIPAKIGEINPVSDKIMMTLSGMGTTRAALAAELLLQHGAQALLSWGTAAALIDDIKPGQLVLPEKILDSKKEWRVHEQWHHKLRNKLRKSFVLSTAPIITSHQVLKNPKEKHALYSQSKALAADMESAAIAEVAAKNGIPFLAIRAISDTANMALPATIISTVDPVGQISVSGIFASIIFRPENWIPIMRLSAGFHTAISVLERLFTSHRNDLYFSLAK